MMILRPVYNLNSVFILFRSCWSVEGRFHRVHEWKVWCHLPAEDGKVWPDLWLYPVKQRHWTNWNETNQPVHPHCLKMSPDGYFLMQIWSFHPRHLSLTYYSNFLIQIRSLFFSLVCICINGASAVLVMVSTVLVAFAHCTELFHIPKALVKNVFIKNGKWKKKKKIYAEALTTNSEKMSSSQEDSWNHWLLDAPNMQSSNHSSAEPHDECWYLQVCVECHFAYFFLVALNYILEQLVTETQLCFILLHLLNYPSIFGLGNISLVQYMYKGYFEDISYHDLMHQKCCYEEIRVHFIIMSWSNV